MTPFNRDAVLDILFESEEQLTARAYIHKIARKLSINAGQAKKILTILVNEQELVYQDLYGGTYVTQSFLKPVRVTEHFSLTPPGMESSTVPNDLKIDIKIILNQGISFGSGHHPTTRLCLDAIDTLFFNSPEIHLNTTLPGADIGTGSGVLAIAICLAGLDKCKAWEIDPNAVSEAKKNVAANDLSHCITIIDDYMPLCEAEFSVICANLRYPTLKQLSNHIQSSLCPKGVIILSGIRQWEKQDLIDHYTGMGFSLIWQKDEKKWSVVIMTNPAPHSLH
ncbi:MAG: 50S ribosomal protein L11 methyltransferase [Desulfobacula sp.]|nr:50S ribosomal protein L11 methyltransferase [Desulfobacula sp.]